MLCVDFSFSGELAIDDAITVGDMIMIIIAGSYGVGNKGVPHLVLFLLLFRPFVHSPVCVHLFSRPSAGA